MDSLLISGGVPLKGTVKSKRSEKRRTAHPLGSILFDHTVIFDNVPHLRDIRTTQKLLETLGFETNFENNRMHSLPEKRSSSGSSL